MAVLLIRRWPRAVPLFVVATALSALETAVYNPTHVLMPLHLAGALARLAFAVEAIALMTRRQGVFGKVGIAIAALAGPAGFWRQPMQFNVASAAVWRTLGCAWAGAAVGLTLALASELRWPRAAQWLRWHALIAAAYFAEQSVMYFVPLGPGSGSEWRALFALHGLIRVAIYGAWIFLFARYRLDEPRARQ